uniref:Reverse transcriptase Ty1/copia-type domain-containing protein n=1 Tax=Glossina palpalis gambiensis TaxID=67801 RepID=A0A1B0BW66_9MUSC
MNRALVEMVGCFMTEAGLPESLCRESIPPAAYFRNCCSIKLDNDKTTGELQTGQMPTKGIKMVHKNKKAKFLKNEFDDTDRDVRRHFYWYDVSKPKKADIQIQTEEMGTFIDSKQHTEESDESKLDVEQYNDIVEKKISLSCTTMYQSKCDQRVYYKKNKNCTIVATHYVDDTLTATNNVTEVGHLVKVLKKNLQIPDLGQLKHCVGLEVQRTDNSILISQPGYPSN